jgi:hypothetical protein
LIGGFVDEGAAVNTFTGGNVHGVWYTAAKKE